MALLFRFYVFCIYYVSGRLKFSYLLLLTYIRRYKKLRVNWWEKWLQLSGIEESLLLLPFIYNVIPAKAGIHVILFHYINRATDDYPFRLIRFSISVATSSIAFL